MPEPLRLPQPAPAADAHGATDRYRHRDTFSPSELALIEQVRNLQIKRGHCYASQAHLAEQLGVSERHVRRLIRTLHEKGVLAITDVPGHPSLLRVTPWGDRAPGWSAGDTPAEPAAPALVLAPAQAGGQPVDSLAPPRTSMSGDPGHGCPTRVGHPCPTESLSLKRERGRRPAKPARRFPAAPQQPTFGDLGRPIRIFELGGLSDPFARAEAAWRRGMFKFVFYGSRVRALLHVEAGLRGLSLSMAPDGGGSDDPPERVTIAGTQLGALVFYADPRRKEGPWA